MSPTPAQSLLAVLKQKKQFAQKELTVRYPSSREWFAKKKISLSDIRAHSARLLTGATLGSALLLAAPHLSLFNKNQTQSVATADSWENFLTRLREVITSQITPDTEVEISANVKKYYQFSAVFSLDNNRIPFYFGSMGLEQHLFRFEGDTVTQHGFSETGMAPARGAFGYFFAQSNKTISQMIDEERFYIVLQTFLIPEWNDEWAELKRWYKFRKFLVINPENGKAVVAVLGDAGPAVWTGKKFGGSPEVMAGLGFYPEKHKGDTIVLFLDDPGNQIPLGPIQFP